MPKKLTHRETVMDGLRWMPRPYRILVLGTIFSAILMLVLLLDEVLSVTFKGVR